MTSHSRKLNFSIFKIGLLSLFTPVSDPENFTETLLSQTLIFRILQEVFVRYFL